jgi:transposase
MPYWLANGIRFSLRPLCHSQVKNSRETIAKALQGDYRREHLFALQQSLDAYRYFRRLIIQLDAELKSCLQELPTSSDAQPELPKGTKLRQKERNDPAFDLRSELYRVVGVDLTNVPGISVMTAQTILSEIGPTVARFPNASAFASWLGLCPEKQVSGGRVLYTRTRKVKNRIANALRMGVTCLYHAKNHLGQFYRRMKRKLGAPKAVTATAHKLARIIYHLLCSREPYDESVFAQQEQSNLRQAELRLRKQAAKLGFQLTPTEANDMP